MRFSEAIRLGGMMTPKAIHLFYDSDNGGMCVQGAALDAIGKMRKVDNNDPLPVDYHPHDEIAYAWPEISTHVKFKDIPREVRHVQGNYRSILRIATHLNNFTNWTRERIADWVATMEDKYIFPQVETTTQGQKELTHA